MVRGGNPESRPIEINQNAYISTNDFGSAHELGQYLQALSNDTKMYASMLKAKDKYQALPHIEIFQKAMCDICKRLQNPVKYKSVYSDINGWMLTQEPCFKPSDIL